MVRAKGAPEPSKHMGHGICDSISKSVTISRPVDDSRAIAKEAINLLQQLNVSASDIRGMGIQVLRIFQLYLIASYLSVVLASSLSQIFCFML